MSDLLMNGLVTFGVGIIAIGIYLTPMMYRNIKNRYKKTRRSIL